jgi:hypothetical protein
MRTNGSSACRGGVAVEPGREACARVPRRLATCECQKLAQFLRPADTHESGRRAGRDVGTLLISVVVRWGGVAGERPGREGGAAGDRCSGARTAAARPRCVVG